MKYIDLWTPYIFGHPHTKPKKSNGRIQVSKILGKASKPTAQVRTTNIEHRPFVLFFKNGILRLATVLVEWRPIEKMGRMRGEGKIR